MKIYPDTSVTLPATQSVTDMTRGIGRSLDLAGHPRRYSLVKLKGVTRKSKVNRNVIDGDTDGGGRRGGGGGGGGGRFMKKRKKKVKKSTLTFVQIATLDPQDRVQQLMKLAEDGRRKSTLLPPLDKESSFARPPRKGANQSSFSDESVDSRKMKKVSGEVDRKIITHLKRHYNKRLQRRLDMTSDTLDYPSDEDTDKHGSDRSGRQGKDGANTIFNKYSETGEKITDSNSRRRKANGKSGTRNVNGLQGTPEEGRTPSENVSNGRESDFAKNSPLPGIRGDAKLNGHSSVRKPSTTSTKQTGKDHRVSVTSADFGNEWPSDEDEEEPSGQGSEAFVSPVATPVPCLSRPETRDNSRDSATEKMFQILDGEVHRRCPADNTILNLYIASGYAETEQERTHLIEHTYPYLRNYFKHYGHELRVSDIHWGFKDMLQDDQKLHDVIKSSITTCHDTANGVNFVILLGQKYGPYILPTEIPKEEMDAICQEAAADREVQLQQIQLKVNEVEAMRAERERSRQSADDSESGATETTESNLPSARHDEEKDEQEASSGEVPTPKDQSTRQALKREQAVMKLVREAEEQLPDINAVCQWYVMDENALPTVFKLQNISTVYKDILKNDFQKRAVAKASFLNVGSKILKLLQTYAPLVIKDKAALRRYFMSGIELETDTILDQPGALRHTGCLIRTIEPIEEHLEDSATQDYLDLASEKPAVLDKNRYLKMQQLRASLSQGKIPDARFCTFLLEWTPGGLHSSTNREHTVHVERVGKALSDMVIHHVMDFIKNKPEVTWRTALFQEVAEHVRMCHEKSKGFQGRKDILTLIKTYLKSDTRRPFVLHGKTGSGKSAIMARAARDISRWFKGKDQEPRVLVRMVGSTMASSNVRTLLRDVCLQLCHIFDQNPNEVPTDYKGVFNDMAYRISGATYDRPLVIFIDALDKLSDEHEARKLQWLPPELPAHAYLIVSTMSDDRFDCLPAARKLLDNADACLVEVPKLPEAEALALFDSWLQASMRTITPKQRDVVVEALKKGPYPHFLQLIYSEVVTWPSYLKSDFTKLGDTIKRVVTLRFGRLERDHGEPLVRRALGYVTAARNGLASNEMEDVLSLDEAVMDDVVATHKPPLRRIPPLLWLRLRLDMADLLAECRADGIKTLTWAHIPIMEAADERYMAQRDKAPSYHKALAEYFQGLWADQPKPYSGNDKGVNRFVAKQILFNEPTDPQRDGSDRIYNLRKINELPFHLMRSQQTMQLKKLCLCNFEWILAKLCGTSLRELLEEYQAILTVEPHEPEIRLLSDVLHLSGKALKREPRQLASQLVGRLHNIVTKDNPRSPGDPRKYPNVHPLIADAKQSSIPALIPSMECLTEPGGILFDILSGHSEPITAMTLTTDGMRALTISQDKTMKLWDIRSGKVVKSIYGMDTNVTEMRTAKNDALVVTVSSSLIQIWSLKNGACVHTISDSVDPAKICIAAEGQILATVFDGSNTFKTWSMDDFSMLCDSTFPDNSIHKENSIVIADSSYGDNVLHAFRSANTATVQNIRSGKILKTLQCHEKSASIVALAISRDYFIVCVRQQYMALHEIHNLELFDAKKGVYIRCVLGCIHDSIRHLFINMVGSHAIAVCASERNNNSNIAMWNLETEDHKHLANHPCVSTMGACLDFRYCMTGAVGETFLRIWDLSTKVNQPAPKLKKQLGVCDILPMIDNPRYVVAKTINNGPISVWNVVKARCLQSAVRIERGLTEGSDALIMRNTRLVILTDRGFSNVSDDSRPVFQTVLVYDLKLKKYVRKLPGCYIVPAPSHEYVLLEDDMLLGPSDNRSHFIIWNLNSGHAVSRIKTNFKELERKRMEQAVLTDVPRIKRATSVMMTPWDRRAESKSAKRRREDTEQEHERQRLEELRKEKDNVVEQFLVSGDQKVIVASFYAHHLCVFDIETQTHTQTLQTEYSMMFLHTAALTFDGGHLVNANYDEDSKISYVTLWDCTTGEIKRRLKRETNVSALAITDDAQRIVIGRSPNEVHIWDPMTSNSLRRISGYGGLCFEMNSKIFVTDGGRRAIVFAGDISVWDLEKGTVLAVFTPDNRITVCDVVLNGTLIVFGMYEKPELVILKLMSSRLKQVDDSGGVDLFGETTGDTTDEEDDEDEDDA